MAWLRATNPTESPAAVCESYTYLLQRPHITEFVPKTYCWKYAWNNSVAIAHLYVKYLIWFRLSGLQIYICKFFLIVPKIFLFYRVTTKKKYGFKSMQFTSFSDTWEKKMTLSISYYHYKYPLSASSWNRDDFRNIIF